jgi:hypothetical protein
MDHDVVVVGCPSRAGVVFLHALESMAIGGSLPPPIMHILRS